MIFENADQIVQMLICAEDDSIIELPVTQIAQSLTSLMATYYVYNIVYPMVYQPLLFSMQDFLMDNAGENH